MVYQLFILSVFFIEREHNGTSSALEALMCKQDSLFVIKSSNGTNFCWILAV